MEISNKLNVLVTGAKGQLGNSIMNVVKNSEELGHINWIWSDLLGDDVDSEMCQTAGLESFSIINLDIRDTDNIESIVVELNIDAIVNCAAWTDVDGAERQPLGSALINTIPPARMAKICKEHNIMLVQISTDYVFGGGKIPLNKPCKEDLANTESMDSALGVYGKTKLAAEHHIQSSGCDYYVILRTSWLYSEYGKNFCKTMMKHISGDKLWIDVVNDQVGTPTYAGDLAKAVVKILDFYNKGWFDKKLSGVYHYSNEGVCSWYDFAKMIAFFMGMENRPILPVSSDVYNSEVERPGAVAQLRAERPTYSVLDKTKIKETFTDIEVPYWVSSLKKCIENITKAQK